MDYKIIDAAYGGLLHDIGKFYQRTYTKSNLTDEELDSTPINRKGGYHDHLHSGYTSRFIKKYLNMYNEFERLTSEHHKEESSKFMDIIKQADYIASAIDRQDELLDTNENNKKGKFIISRMYSVFNEVDFGKERKSMMFPLSSLKEFSYPVSHYPLKDLDNSAKEYKEIFNEFLKEIEDNIYLKQRIDYHSYNLMYNLMNNYFITVPASTYGNIQSSVSLFDHLKLTSSIASCLSQQESLGSKKFYMLELDTSGIQSFIYQITEGSGTKSELTKTLRGRSIFVGLLSNAIAYAFLNEFNLTVSNILFNTGGGCLILLPYLNETISKVDQLSLRLRKQLFQLFQTDITFVNAIIELNDKELTEFQSDKAIELKQLLGSKKMKKFSDIINKDFFYEKAENNDTCNICGRMITNGYCMICDFAKRISNIYVKNNSFGILYDFSLEYDGKSMDTLDLTFVKIHFIKNKEDIIGNDHVRYVDSINDFGYGNQRFVSNLVPLNKKENALNFEEIINLTPLEYGDRKLAILKMDVDNLGGIFAFGLRKIDEHRNQRAISKFVTMSRLLEYFFGHEIKEICKEVSLNILPTIEDKVINQSMFYINYAGGDDLVIMGSAYSIVYLAQAICQKFKQFVGNDNITISGGIHFQTAKKPIRFGVLEAEKQLELSKNNGKNAISLLDTTVSFNEYEKLLNEVFEMVEYINDERLSRTLVYNIMTFISDKTYNEYVYLVPRIQYTLFRNMSKYKDIYEQMKQEINALNCDECVRRYELKLKLVIMFTRDVK